MGFVHPMGVGASNLNLNMSTASPLNANMNTNLNVNSLRSPGDPVMMGGPAGLGGMSDLLGNNLVYKQNLNINSPGNLSNLGASNLSNLNAAGLGTGNLNNGLPNNNAGSNAAANQTAFRQILGLTSNQYHHSMLPTDSHGNLDLPINLSGLNLGSGQVSSATSPSALTAASVLNNGNSKNANNNGDKSSNNSNDGTNNSNNESKSDNYNNNNAESSDGSRTNSASGPSQNNGTNSLSAGSTSNSSAPSTTIGRQTSDDDKVFTWILELMHGPNSEQALLELGKKREQYEDLALILWHSFGVMTCLLQEIIYVYPLLSPPQLTSTASNRVCNALALLQCIASHDSTRQPFLNAHIPLFLYPFLNTTSKSRSFEYLRLTSLGVIGALVKNDSPDVINFLLSTEIIPLCLRIMESGTELSKTVAIFILQKILMDDEGLRYICQTFERFMAVSSVLSNIVEQLVGSPTARLLKHVVRCYLRLSDNDRACNELKTVLPEPLRDGTFSRVLKDDGATKRCLAQLLRNLSDNDGQQQLSQQPQPLV